MKRERNVHHFQLSNNNKNIRSIQLECENNFFFDNFHKWIANSKLDYEIKSIFLNSISKKRTWNDDVRLLLTRLLT